jgi:hypothetical protein
MSHPVARKIKPVIILLGLEILYLPSVTRGQDDWKYDILRLKNGTIVQGLLLRETSSQVIFQSVRRPPGSRTIVITTTYQRDEVAEIDKLNDKDREVLIARLKARDPEGKVEKTQMEALVLEPAAWGKDPKGGLSYSSDHFLLVSNAKEEIVRRAAVRLEQIYAAYTRFLPPRRKALEPTKIILVRSLAEYRAMLKEQGRDILNPAFFDSRRNQVVCASELEKLGEDLQKVHQYHKDLLAKIKKQEMDLKKDFRGAVPASMQREFYTARQQVRQTEAKNDAVFQDATRHLFQTLYHEAFHAYLANDVYPPRENDVPRWLNEGLAQIFETAILEGGELRVGHADPKRLPQIKTVARKGDLVPLQELLQAGAKQFVVAHAGEHQVSDRYYMNSWALAFYLMFDRRLLGTRSLDRYVRNLKQGANPVEEFQRLVGKSLSRFEEDFRQYLLALREDGTPAIKREKPGEPRPRTPR